MKRHESYNHDCVVEELQIKNGALRKQNEELMLWGTKWQKAF
jgi:hypothetical protein